MANGTWRNTRNRGGYQLPLTVLFVLAVAIVLIGKAQTTLFDRARANVTDWMAPGLQVVHRPFDWVSGWWHNASEGFGVYQENVRLKEENARLRQWQTAAIMLQSQVKRYQSLLHAVPDPALSSVLAHVIGRAKRPFLETMILDAGKANTVKPGQAVIDARGMIGRIFLAGNHTSWVILLTDLNSRIPVSIEPAHSPALLAGDNQKAPMLETLAQGVNVKPGDQVVSSGDGGILPPGIPIGTVIADGAGYRVALLSDPATSQEVAVVDFKNPMETPPTPTAKDLPVTAAGLPPAAPPPPMTETASPPATAAQTPIAPKQIVPAPKKDTGTKPAVVAKPAGADTASPTGDDPVDDQ